MDVSLPGRNYFIKIVLGDPWHDGHNTSEEIYFTVNKSPKQIQEALDKVKANCNFDIFDAFSDYGKCTLTETEYDNLSSKYKVEDLFEHQTLRTKNRETDEMYDYLIYWMTGETNQSNILFEIAKLELPDLTYKEQKIEVDGEFEYGYGFFE